MKLSQLSDEDPTIGPYREASEFCDRISALLDEGKCDWASDTLRGIYDTVTRTSRVTEGQRRAIDNIEEQSQRSRR